jgi:glycine/D-amino acid oxidase-like deaminating enzyme
MLYLFDTKTPSMIPSQPSPWLAQLKQDRPHHRMSGGTDYDMVIVGAGIAGVSSAYQLLKRTTGKILLLDAGRVAHGATGRNAGHVVSEFERPLEDIVRGFGFEMAMHGQAALESAWDILEEIFADTGINTPYYKCTGYNGFTNLERLIVQLETHAFDARAGIPDEPILVCANDDLMQSIPTHLHPYALQVPLSMILHALGTEDTHFIAAEVTRIGCMNSALFCEELVLWMLQHYAERFTVAEHLPVITVTLEKNDAVLETTEGMMSTRRVILCTNGFENFSIINHAGAPIDPAFHASVQGVIGYMAGYLDAAPQSVSAICYHHEKEYLNPYYYLTRRPFINAAGQTESLVCIGGPERLLPDRAEYDPGTPLPGDIEEELDRVLHQTYRNLPASARRTFVWQGLMCYTPNSIRRIGYEPLNTVLLYNLGCNGVGILPSIYGGKRIAELLSGIHLPASIFDPALGNL